MENQTLIRRLTDIEQRLAGIDTATRELSAEIAQIRTALGMGAGLAARAPAAAPPSLPTPPATSSRAAVWVLIGVLVLLVAVGGGGFFLLRNAAAERVKGHVAVTGGPFGAFTFDAQDCDSGASYTPRFFGADIKAEGQQLRVYASGQDARLALFRPRSKQAISLDRESCSRWDVLVDWAGVQVNNVATVNGHLHVTCSLPEGGTLIADADFSRCAF